MSTVGNSRDPSRTPDETLWTDEDTAAYLREVSPRTLERWRALGSGPPWVKIGRRVRYSPPAVKAWVAAQTQARPVEAGIAP
jgi:hypothetical protein